MDFQSVNARLEDFKEILVKNNYSESSIKKFIAAFEFAKFWHGEQKRKSGEPYIIHPLETAIKLAEWKMDDNTIIAGLLHDLLEDTPVDKRLISSTFNNDVLELVRVVTKISSEAKRNRESAGSFNPHKNELDYTIRVFSSISKDIRPIIIKIADRFHNLSTINFLRPDRQKIIAQETFDTYAQIAGRLGMYWIKTQLLDLTFQIINPTAFDNTLSLINVHKLINETKWKNFEQQIRKILDGSHLSYELTSRIKSVYSTYQKLNYRHNIKNIHDIYALRVIVENEFEAYHVLGLVHLNYKYVPGLFKDYICAPKNNLYQSIHTTVLVDGAQIEVQIRTKSMDRNSHLGLASHWAYKLNQDISQTDEYKTEVLNRFQVDIFNEKKAQDLSLIKDLTKGSLIDVLVSNNNKSYSLPSSITALELAYRVNPEEFIFLDKITCSNDIISFDKKLDDGDVVSFEYSSEVKISESWLKSIKNPAIKKEIIAIIEQINSYEETEAQFLAKLRKILKKNVISSSDIVKRVQILGFNDLSEYIKYVSKINFKNNEQYEFFSKNYNWKKTLKQLKINRPKWLFQNSYFKEIPGIDFASIKISKCCSILPYIPSAGLIQKNILNVHSPNCKNIKKLNNEKIIALNWNDEKLESKPRLFRSYVKVHGAWSGNVINDILMVIINNNAKIFSLSITKDKKNNTFFADLGIYVQNMKHLNFIMDEITLKDMSFNWKLL
ncbi:RelA/SpoT family protein [Mycoplasma bradburyae]|uniref:Penta-phosphate guanosine-3'-pyrophosphohydrolase n=1 Tax=Mycoplasma bradburyae TaxID=2963128 RepID=A0AAW6HSE1_9MOLU|nr:RelA/SpoT family protein [Mycoplasma bradburyae]MDC4183583.1 RelA/SpoT family protein [Mycoplasma bradburyae]UTS71020.1 RelA/SpoT family protein [Mycoplasma bradburyae]